MSWMSMISAEMDTILENLGYHHTRRIAKYGPSEDDMDLAREALPDLCDDDLRVMLHESAQAAVDGHLLM